MQILYNEFWEVTIEVPQVSDESPAFGGAFYIENCILGGEARHTNLVKKIRRLGT